MIEHEIAGQMPGAVVAVARAGEVALVRPYGHADVATGAVVDAQETLFRVGSISKLVTATAAMQLVEKRRLDLDIDVNTYLPRDCRIPATFAEPVTLRNLLTHTGGFEESQIGSAKRSQADVVPLRRTITHHRPARVRPPTTDFNDATGAAYSNWGLALAGFLVALRSGMSFEEYVERHLFAPLAMQRSTFREPLPEGWEAHLARGHVLDGRRFVPQGFTYFGSVGPACSLTTTGADMGRFMAAHLALGVLDGRRILSEEMALLMRSRVLNPSFDINGAGLGFCEVRMNGLRGFGHGGLALHSCGELLLLPERGVGFFAAANMGGGAKEQLSWVVRDFVDEYFPRPKGRRRGRRGDTDVRPWVGAYFATAHAYTRNEKALLLCAPSFESRLAAHSKGLTVTNRGEFEWHAVGPSLFRESGDRPQEHMALVEDPQGVPCLLGPMPFMPSRMLARHEEPGVHWRLLAGVSAAFAVFLAYLAGSTLFEASVAGDAPFQPWLAAARALSGSASAAGLCAWWLLRRLRERWSDDAAVTELAFGFPGDFRWAVALATAAATGAVLLVPCLFVACKGGAAGMAQCAPLAVWLLPAGAFVWSMNHWNLVGWKVAW